MCVRLVIVVVEMVTAWKLVVSAMGIVIVLMEVMRILPTAVSPTTFTSSSQALQMVIQ